MSIPAGMTGGQCITSGCGNDSFWLSVETARCYSGGKPCRMCRECCDRIAHLTVRDTQMSDLYWALANWSDTFAFIDNADDMTEAIELRVNGQRGQIIAEHYHGGYSVGFYTHAEHAPSRTHETTLLETGNAWICATAMSTAAEHFAG